MLILFLFTLNIIMSDDCFRVLNCMNLYFFHGQNKRTQHCIESAIMIQAGIGAFTMPPREYLL